MARRTPADRKGGHLVVRRSDRRLVLRETAQTPEEDLAAAGDIERHGYFNTNNLWLDLRALAGELERTGESSSCRSSSTPRRSTRPTRRRRP
ncbi:UTP--glucose-1-phosphate uridylyltransferase [Oerskovia sp. M15]